MLATLTTILGERARNPLQYVEKVWPDDPLAHGGYATNPAPRVWTEHGAPGWRTACGPVHWAENSSVWNGYIDGAINSGHRAAAKVMAALRS